MKTPVRLGAALATGALLASCSPPELSAEAEELLISASAEDPARAVDVLSLNSEGLLAGTARPDLPEGEQGVLSVVAVGRPEQAEHAVHLPFAFRNNTDKAVSHRQWDATARSGDNPIAVGSSRATTPTHVQPGDIGFASVLFPGGEELPHDAEFDFEAKPQAQGGALADISYSQVHLTITEGHYSDQALTAVTANETGAEIHRPYDVQIYCFDGDTLLSESAGSLIIDEEGSLGKGEKLTVSAGLLPECPAFVFGVSGWSHSPAGLFF